MLFQPAEQRRVQIANDIALSTFIASLAPMKVDRAYAAGKAIYEMLCCSRRRKLFNNSFQASSQRMRGIKDLFLIMIKQSILIFFCIGV